EILAEPADAVRVPVEMLADANDAAMMVLHVLVEVDLLHGEVLRDFDELRSDAVSGRHVDVVLMLDRSRDDGDGSRPRASPEHLSVRRSHARESLLRELDVLTDAVDLANE